MNGKQTCRSASGNIFGATRKHYRHPSVGEKVFFMNFFPSFVQQEVGYASIKNLSIQLKRNSRHFISKESNLPMKTMMSVRFRLIWKGPIQLGSKMFEKSKMRPLALLHSSIDFFGRFAWFRLGQQLNFPTNDFCGHHIMSIISYQINKLHVCVSQN